MAEHLCFLSLPFLNLEKIKSPGDILNLLAILNDQQIDSCNSLYKISKILISVDRLSGDSADNVPHGPLYPC